MDRSGWDTEGTSCFRWVGCVLCSKEHTDSSPLASRTGVWGQGAVCYQHSCHGTGVSGALLTPSHQPIATVQLNVSHGMEDTT